MKIINVVGARPNFMKIAPIMAAMRGQPNLTPLLAHTGQHYDSAMSDAFFQDLEMPPPDVFLGVGSDSQTRQTAKIMLAFEEVVLNHKPDIVLTVGDVNSTLACSLVAAKLGVKIAHVEAGLRSRDRAMPEEVNRLVTDVLSDYLFTTSADADDNLRQEGIAPEKIFFVGNTMIDTLVKYEAAARARQAWSRLPVEPGHYLLMTLHRPSNVDSKAMLERLLPVFEEVQARLPIIFPIHPRTQKKLHEFGLDERFAAMKNLHCVPPQSYIDFISLMQSARFVMTDSGGLQEETTYLGIPCLTLRENTERPVTITLGTNELVGLDPENILRHIHLILSGQWKKGQIPPLWDGHAADRIVAALLKAC